MIDINHLENFLWQYFGESLVVKANPNPGSDMVLAREQGIYNIQEIAPDIADWLHEQGVDIDWTDRSRYGTPPDPLGDAVKAITIAELGGQP